MWKDVEVGRLEIGGCQILKAKSFWCIQGELFLKPETPWNTGCLWHNATTNHGHSLGMLEITAWLECLQKQLTVGSWRQVVLLQFSYFPTWFPTYADATHSTEGNWQCRSMIRLYTPSASRQEIGQSNTLRIQTYLHTFIPFHGTILIPFHLSLLNLQLQFPPFWFPYWPVIQFKTFHISPFYRPCLDVWSNCKRWSVQNLVQSAVHGSLHVSHENCIIYIRHIEYHMKTRRPMVF